ncbi:hypothetical protein Y032_0028g1671 [Ancylostoma ceylanicum]|uniref:Uncharacterized protein n=1 Tax=Ancylostoma ceylanicum TaxID=53326 RepID=A0A016UUG4_9BILA|nr:hypothetical protein Y032_0028g1671 [Ancylostoma ceylanicum]
MSVDEEVDKERKQYECDRIWLIRRTFLRKYWNEIPRFVTQNVDALICDCIKGEVMINRAMLELVLSNLHFGPDGFVV